MKFVSNLIAASALVATSLAQAASVNVAVGDRVSIGNVGEVRVISGTGSLYFSNGTEDPTLPTAPVVAAVGGLVGALNVGRVTLSAVDDAVITEEERGVGRYGKPARAVVNINAQVSSLGLDQSTGKFTLVTTQGGATQTSPFIEHILDGGRITVKALAVDLQTKSVYAQLDGNPLNSDGATYGAPVSYSGVLWTFENIVGPVSLTPEALAAATPLDAAPDVSGLIALGYQIISNNETGVTFKAVNKITGLKVTSSGFDTFAAALGLTEGSTGYSTLMNVNNTPGGWGSMVSETVFTTAVPEPSTYGMVSVGLIGVGLFAYRRRRETAQSH